MNIKVTASAMALLVVAGGAMAQDAGSGPFSAEFVIELQNDWTFDSTDPAAEFNNTFATIEGALSYSFTQNTSINSTLVFEQITGPVDDSFLEDHGLYVQELFFSHNFGGAEVILGKFNPAFGVAWDAAPGIYGVDFAEDYEITEKLGGAVIVPFETAGGSHELSFAAFQADRTALSDSLGEERGQTSLPMGGVSNTDGIESFALTLSGEFGATGYNIGLQHQGRGTGDAADQTGAVFGITHAFEGGSFPVEVLAEVAWFDEFDGTTNSATYGTVGVAFPLGPVTVSGVYSVRDIQTMPTDRLATLSAEMELAEGLTGAIGYRHGREGGVKSQTIGTLIVYEF